MQWAVYVDDNGDQWARRVDADQLLETGRGWTTDGVELHAPIPRGWLPRRVRGLDDEGREGFAVVASVSAPLWTGSETAFTIEGSDQLPHVAQVVEWFAEKRVVVRP